MCGGRRSVHSGAPGGSEWQSWGAGLQVQRSITCLTSPGDGVRQDLLQSGPERPRAAVASGSSRPASALVALAGLMGKARGLTPASPVGGVALRRGLGGQGRDGPHPSFAFALGSAPPCSGLSWKRDVSVRLSGLPSSDHLASATPTPTCFFFLEGLAPVGGGERPGPSTQ